MIFNVQIMNAAMRVLCNNMEIKFLICTTGEFANGMAEQLEDRKNTRNTFGKKQKTCTKKK